MNDLKKDFETTHNSLSKSNTNDVADILTSNDKNSISQKEENLNEEIKDFFTFDERTPKEIEWLWKPYIVKGNLNIIQGNGGLGKSFLTTWLLSAISNGEKVPFREEYFEKGTSILQNAEDDPDSTILPRLIANGAILERIGYINEENKAFNVLQLERLEEKIKEFKPQVVVIDPLTSYLGGVNMHVANEVRDTLKPLKEMAQKYNCAMVFIMHLNKNTNNAQALYRTIGSIDFVSIARSVLMVTENPEDSTERLLIPVKTNLMKEDEKRTLSYKITDSGAIEWIADKGALSADKILNQNESTFNKDSIVKGFILGILSKEDIPSNELKTLVLNKGNFSEKAYNIAKSELRKEDLIDYYQKDKKFFWTFKKGDKKND